MARKRRAAPAPTQVHELEITLRDSKPPIWRRIAVPSNLPLSELHEIIQIAMGWTNSHLHQFIVRDVRPKPTREQLAELTRKEDWAGLDAATHRDDYFSDPAFELENSQDESEVTVAQLLPAVKKKCLYEYDFGDSWEHEVLAARIGPPQAGTTYPVCLDGALACPPEDCGGIYGYYDMVDALRDPKHRNHQDVMEWFPEDFDPEAFDLVEVNAALKELR